jgi:hypothetical protein
MSWFWLNIPVGALFFLATAGIPVYMVLKYPDERRPQRAAHASDATPQSRPVFAATGPHPQPVLV